MASIHELESYLQNVARKADALYDKARALYKDYRYVESREVYAEMKALLNEAESEAERMTNEMYKEDHNSHHAGQMVHEVLYHRKCRCR